jgi:hypothetical protein
MASEIFEKIKKLVKEGKAPTIFKVSHVKKAIGTSTSFLSKHTDKSGQAGIKYFLRIGNSGSGNYQIKKEYLK